MPSYTTSLRLVQPATGEYSGTWGTQVNNGITALVDTSVAGTASITMTAADYTLSTANGATDEARAMFLVLGGAPGAARNVICPAVSKLYFVTNNTGFAQTVKTAAGTGISVPNGASMTLRCDGTNVVEALNAFGNISYTGTLTGSTGVINIGSGQIYKDGSGNVGIGTSSPGEKLAINQGNLYAIRTGGAKLRLADENNEVSVESSPTGVVSNMIFKTAATTQMTLDSSGNLGLGVTPSAAIAGTTIEVGVNKSGAFGALGSGPVDNAYVSANAYPTGSADPAFTSWKYTRTGFAAKYEAGRGGAHQWFTAPSGTAGNAISFTQAMTLDASGNLAVGTSAAVSSRIHAEGNGVTIRMKTTGAIGSGSTCFLQFDGSEGDSGYFGFGGAANVMDVWNRRNGAMTFGTNNTERARITSGGDWLVGKTAADFTVAGAEVKPAGNIELTRNSVSNCLQINKKGNAGDLMAFYYNDAAVVGTITNSSTNTAYNTSSDRRLKENIAPAADAGAVIDAIEVVQHDWKVGGHTRFGVIAQDLNAVAPEAVSAGDDGDEIEKTWGVDYSKLVPMLIKEVQSLRARVAALEAK